MQIGGRYRVLIVGNGTAGTLLKQQLMANSHIEIVGVLDDVPGPNVMGPIRDLASIVQKLQPDEVYIAIPSAPQSVIDAILSDVDFNKTSVRYVSRTHAITGRGDLKPNDLTDSEVLELLGRPAVEEYSLAASEAIRGKTILVTGAAGSIGSRLVEHLLSLGALRIVAVDQAEKGLVDLFAKFETFEALTCTLGNITSEAFLSGLFSRFHPDIVFHAAAYKHVPVLEQNPLEGFNNNTLGTFVVCRVAGKFRAEKVVYISTDKAVEPGNILGATKRIGEVVLPQFHADYPDTEFRAVRFGNVLQSSGSVLEIFKAQLAAGAALTVTHPAMTRYFMTIDEACRLVIQAASEEGPGGLFLLDMGEPVRIMDVARRLIERLNPACDIHISGIRPGEKLTEELTYGNSDLQETGHPKIFRVREDTRQSSGAIVLEWATKLGERTSSYSVSAQELVKELSEAGFLSASRKA